MDRSRADLLVRDVRGQARSRRRRSAASSTTTSPPRAPPALARVLDIGCGWGALLNRLVEHASVANAVGLTLSPSQARWIRANARPGVEVREEHWCDHVPGTRYDAIISIGAFEHFVHRGLDAESKLAGLPQFLRILRPRAGFARSLVAADDRLWGDAERGRPVHLRAHLP